MKRHSLEEFILSSDRNLYVREMGLVSYYRKGPAYINGVKYQTLTRANTTNNPRRPSNIEMNPRRRSTGRYRKLDELTMELARKHGFEAVMVESVLNNFLIVKLVEYGYTKIDSPFGGPPNFFRLV